MLIHRMTVHINMNRKMNIVTVIAVLDLIVMFILAQFWFNLYVVILPLYILLFCCSIIFSCCFVHNPTYFKEYAATASAVTTGGFSLFGAWISNAMDHYLTLNTQIPLIYGYMLLIGVCILARLISYMHHKKL